MGMEDLQAIAEAAAEQAAEEEQEKRLLPALEPMTCTLASGAKVMFDVPNTRKV